MFNAKCIKKSNVKFKKVTKLSNGFSDEFTIYKTILWPCGLWPLYKSDTFNKLRYAMAIISQIFLFSSLIIEIIYKCANPVDMLEYYTISTVTFLSLAKLLLLRIHFIRISNNISFAQKNWITIVDNDLREIMKNFSRPGKYLYYTIMITVYGIIVQYALFPFIFPRNDTSNLPMKTVCLYADLNVVGHYSIYIFEFVALYLAVVAFIGNDIFFCGLVMHFCGQLKILEVQYIKIGQSVCSSACLQKIIDLVEKHCHLIARIEDLKISFNMILLLQFLVTGFLITSQGLTFLLAVKDGDLFFAIKAAEAVPILLAVCLMYCYSGQLLEYYYVNLNNSIYCSHWYLLPPKIRRYLIFSMMQTVKPLNLTAGKMFDVKMNTFINFIKFIFSFFSFVTIIFNK